PDRQADVARATLPHVRHVRRHHEAGAREESPEPEAPDERTERLRAYHGPSSRRRGQADAAAGRFPPREVRDPGAGRRDRVLPESLGAAGPAALPGRREALY